MLLAFVAGAVLADAEEVAAPVREGPRVLDPREHRVGELVPDVAFTDADGKAGKLSDFRGKPLVVVARSVTCPICRKYGPRLAALEDEYREKGVAFLVLGVAEHDDEGEIRKDRKTRGFEAPWVPHGKSSLASALGVRSTAEVFVIDGARTLVYRGAVDDQYGLGYALAEPREEYLRRAIDAALSRRPPAVQATTAPGCVIDLSEREEDDAAPTYHGRVSRILDRHCVDCHRDGEAGPFPLDTLEDARGNRAMIRLMVERRLMPPWFAEGDSVPMRNDGSLSERDRGALLAWIEAGCPEGDEGDAAVPIARAPGWRIGEPDVVLQTPRAIAVPAEGVVPYKYAWIRTDFDEDRWIQAFEVRPTHPQVVHHVLVFAHYPYDHPRAEDQPRDRNGLGGYFAAMVPGQGHLVFPDGAARFLPKGTRLRFQIHYTPNGDAVEDQPKLALRFADGPPEREVRSRGIFNTRFEIPPGAARHEVKARVRFGGPVRLLSLTPHMHVRGTAFRYVLHLPDGTRRTLLDVPRYDFNWQLNYELREPIDVPAGAVMHCTAWYDNSARNPANPDPTATVGFGEQTWDEMMIGYVEYHALD
jgi:peroxiredoxin